MTPIYRQPKAKPAPKRKADPSHMEVKESLLAAVKCMGPLDDDVFAIIACLILAVSKLNDRTAAK